MQVIFNLYTTDVRDSETMLTTGAGEAADMEPDGWGGRVGLSGRGASGREGEGGGAGKGRPGGSSQLAQEGEGLVGVEEDKMTKVRPKQSRVSRRQIVTPSLINTHEFVKETVVIWKRTESGLCSADVDANQFMRSQRVGRNTLLLR